MQKFKKALTIALTSVILSHAQTPAQEEIPYCDFQESQIHSEPPPCMRPGVAYEECSCFNHMFWSTVIIGSAVVAVIIVALCNTPHNNHGH